MQKENTDTGDLVVADDSAAPGRPRRARWKVPLIVLIGLMLLLMVVGWLTREQIVDNLISRELAQRGIPASYTVESIGPRRQVLADLVIGDPTRPDFTAEQVVVSIAPRFGLPSLRSVKLVEPRIYGTYVAGKLSFGSLDPLIFTESKEPFRLPNLRLTIDDGRGLIEGDHGAVGIKFDGSGNLRSGFDGTLAAVSPDLTFGACAADRTTIYGKVSIRSEKPQFSGPLRVGNLTCGQDGPRLAKLQVQTDVTAGKALDSAEGRLSFSSSGGVFNDNRMAKAGGTARFTWSGDDLTARYDLEGQSIGSSPVDVARLGVSGRIRALNGMSRIEVDGDVDGKVAGLGKGSAALLETARASAEGTFAGDVAGQIRTALLSEARNSTVNGSFIFRRNREGMTLIVPNALMRGSSGPALLSISRMQLRMTGTAPLQFSGNLVTGGKGLPRIGGSMRQGAGGTLSMDLRMPEYRAGAARVALPGLSIFRQSNGSLGFAGEARITGALPGGMAENLILPLEGAWSDVAGLSAWRRCTTVQFDRLQLAQLTILKRGLSVCPPRGGSIVRSGPNGLKIAAGVPSLNLSGRLGQTPIRLASGPVGFAWPGNLDARAVEVSLGAADAPSRFRITHLQARLANTVSGTFAGADVLLSAVPLDIRDLSGTWRYADGALDLSDGALRLEDREQVDRFQPLIARDATLRLVDNAITADTLFREPQSDREVVQAHIRHNLADASGSADLTIDALKFDQALQPDTLTHMALGVIANAQGVVTGTGRIDWNENALTSHGTFSTDNLDFAAAFGPVRGVSGTIVFTDLLGLVTEPSQTLHIASINPGIEVNDGVLTFDLRPGYMLSVHGAQWPFLGGTLHLEPVSMQIGSGEAQRYVLKIEGLDAALFLERMELGNLAATGVFDGMLPLVFDQDGGRIEGGYLNSRPPGGNVSYVGELTYKDLSAMANFAFDALRSVDYRVMRIDLDGALAGEIVTRVTFDGISQGEGATSNFLTRRIARLPIRFRVNVRAPFMQMVSSVRSLYDPAFIRDPRALGIVDERGMPIASPTPVPPPNLPDQTPMPAIRPQGPTVQPPESDATP